MDAPNPSAIAVAVNGREALDCLKSDQPDLVLLDLMMPEMDGFEFLAEFRKDSKFASTPVIVVTAADLSPADRHRLDGGSRIHSCEGRLQ
jgi:adenylate cyclase